MSEDNKELTKQLKTLNKNIDLLTKVTAISVGKDAFFEGMEEKEDKVEALGGLDLPDRIIALLIGSTPDSVKSLRSKKKTRLKKAQAQPTKEEVKQK